MPSTDPNDRIREPEKVLRVGSRVNSEILQDGDGGWRGTWRLVALAVLAIGVVHLVVLWFGSDRGLATIGHRILLDPDAYMWLNRVLHLRESAGWFDHLYPRINPPEGHVQHWTRPLDGFLLLGGGALGALLGFRDGLFYWGFFFPPILHGITAVALLWAARPLIRSGALPSRGAPVLLLVFVIQLPIYLPFLAGRPDHHAVLVLLFTLYLGFWTRVVLDPCRGHRNAVGLGLVGALALWVNVEALIFVTVGMVGLGLSWLWKDPTVAVRAAVHSAVMAGGILVALLVEWGPGPFPGREMDTLALSHLWLMICATGFWGSLIRVERGAVRWSEAGRMGAAGALALGTLGVLFLTVPEFFGSPLANVDPFYRATRLERISELQSLTSLIGSGGLGAVASAILFAGIALVGIPWLLFAAVNSREGRQRAFHLAFALLGLVYLFLAFGQRRWTDYLALSMVIPYVFFAVWILDRVAAGTPAPPGGNLGARMRRAGALAALVLGPSVLGIGLGWASMGPVAAEEEVAAGPPGWDQDRLASAVPDAEQVLETERGCDLVAVGEVLSEPSWFPEPTLILAHTDYGPELLFRTPHSVLSIPNHRQQPGYRFSHEVMGHPDPAAAAELLRGRGVGVIVLCAEDITSGFWSYPSVQEPFVRWLSEGGIPVGFVLHSQSDAVRIYRSDGPLP